MQSLAERMAENAHNSWALQLKKSDGNSLEYVTYCTRYVICPDLGGVHPSLHTAIVRSLVYMYMYMHVRNCCCGLTTDV